MKIKSNIFNVDGDVRGVERGSDSTIIFKFYPEIEIKIEHFDERFAKHIVTTGLTRLKTATIDFDKNRIILDENEVTKK